MNIPAACRSPHVQVLAAVALMSAVFPTMKIALREIDARALYLARFEIAALAILALWCVAPPRVAGVGSRLWGVIVVLALLRGPVHQLLLGGAAAGVSSGMLALLGATAPIHVAWMGALLLRERVHARTLLALGLAGTAVLLPILCGDGLHASSWWQFGLGAAAALIAGLSTVAARGMRAYWGAWENTSVSVVVAAALSLPMLTGDALAQLARAGLATWTCIIYQALAVQILGLWLLFSALQRLPAVTAAIYQFLALALTAAWGALLLGETYRAIDAVAVVCVLAAVVMQVAWKRSPIVPTVARSPASSF